MKMTCTNSRENDCFITEIKLVDIYRDEMFWKYLPEQENTILFKDDPFINDVILYLPSRNKVGVYGIKVLNLFPQGILAVSKDPLNLRNISTIFLNRINELMEEAKVWKSFGTEDAPGTWYDHAIEFPLQF
jgi:hypothetical protein